MAGARYLFPRLPLRNPDTANLLGEPDTRGEFNDGLSQQLIDGEQTIDLGSIIDLNADEVGIVIDAHASTLAGTRLPCYSDKKFKLNLCLLEGGGKVKKLDVHQTK